MTKERGVLRYPNVVYVVREDIYRAERENN